jgi:hypothetical protein
MFRKLALVAFALAVTVAPLRAQLIVGNDQTGLATIYNINVTTGVATAIYSSTGPESRAWGMAYDGGSNTLYWNNGNTLYSSALGATLTPTNLGTFTYNGGAVNFVALAFINGNLYGTRNIATEGVYQINPTTLVATLLFAYPTGFDMGGLDVDVTTGRIYGLSDAGPAGLYEFDLVGQTQTFRAPYPGGETDIDGLAVHNGLAYYVTDGPNGTQPNFYIYNIATGQQVGTLASPFTGSGTFSAATFAAVPEPSTVALLAAAGVGGWVLKRRRAKRS